MGNGDFVKELASRISSGIRPYCSRVRIVGSIRRGEEDPEDVDIVCIPKDKEGLEDYMAKIGKKFEGGEYESTWEVEGVRVELYYTNDEEFGAELLAYSSEKGASIGLRMIAKKKGMKLTQHGLFDLKTGKKIAGESEEEIYNALGREYKPASER